MKFGMLWASRLARGGKRVRLLSSKPMMQFNACLCAAITMTAGAQAADVNIASNVASGVNLDSQTGSTVQVFPGVSVSNASNSALSATTSAWALTNDGAISATIFTAVSLAGAGSSVTNTSAITSGAKAIALANGGTVDNRAGATITAGTNAISIGSFRGPGAGTVTNAGTITQVSPFSGDLVALLWGGTVTNLQGGIISAQSSSNAVSVGQGVSRTVINSGVITNTGTRFATGVLVQGGASTVTNNATGEISGTFNGVFSSSSSPLTLTNHGLIASTGTAAAARAVEADGGGTIVNSGTIRSASSDGLYLRNASTVTNSGTITGHALAINFANSATNTLTLDTGSVLNGNVRGGTGTNNLVLSGTGTEDISKFLSFQTLAMRGSAWTLTGNNTFSAHTTVESGNLNVNGQLTSPDVTVQSGGTLSGTGTIVGATTIASGGTIAPGSNAIGTLNINGNIAFATGSTYQVKVDATGQSDRIAATGTAALGDAKVNAVFAPGMYVDRTYTILTAAGGISGTFDATVVTTSPNIQSTLSYDANDAFLNIRLDFETPGSPLTVNQRNVANALTTFFTSTGSIPSAFAMLSPAELTIASGELATGAIQSSIDHDHQFLNLLLDPSIAGRGFAATNSQPVNRRSVWAAAYGGSGDTGGDAVTGSHDISYRAYGVAVGTDLKLAPDWLAGFAVAGGGGSFSLADGLGSGTSDVFQIGAYARHDVGPAYLSAALAYGSHDMTTDRTVAIDDIEHLQARFHDDAFAGRLEGGYRLTTPYLGVTPYAAAQAIRVLTPDYAERSLSGSGQFALNYAAETTTDIRSEFGVRADKSFAMPDGTLTLRGRAAWAHDYDPARVISAEFEELPGAAFVVNGARLSPDNALLSAAVERQWWNGITLSGGFESQLSDNTASYAGRAVAKYRW